jgi:hypothetical protein
MTTTTRPRGFVAWNPNGKSKELLAQVQQVLDTYKNLLPLTGRQIFYRLVATTGYDKTELAYKRLLNLLNRARRAKLISMEHIRDDGTITKGNNRYESGTQFLETCLGAATNFKFDLMAKQPIYMEIICEAAGMLPQLERVASPYGIVVRSSGGFDSTTVKHELGLFYANKAQYETTVLHIGDLDPSGEHICSSLAQDIARFCSYYDIGGIVETVRVAVTAEQQAEFNLPTSPPKPGDNRTFSADFTVQAEALPPNTLAEIVEMEIVKRLDMKAWQDAIQEQTQYRIELAQMLEPVCSMQVERDAIN